MNIFVYNKTYLWSGFIIGTLGGYLGDEKIVPFYIEIALMIAGIILLILSMKKPKNAENEEL